MIWIKSVYKIPAQRHVFLIVSDCTEISEISVPLDMRKKRLQYIQNIVRCKDSMRPKKTSKWTVKLVREDEFSTAISKQIGTSTEVANASFQKPLDIELLCMNLMQFPDHINKMSLDSPKELSTIDSMDVIEVFI